MSGEPSEYKCFEFPPRESPTVQEFIKWIDKHYIWDEQAISLRLIASGKLESREEVAKRWWHDTGKIQAAPVDGGQGAAESCAHCSKLDVEFDRFREDDVLWGYRNRTGHWVSCQTQNADPAGAPQSLETEHDWDESLWRDGEDDRMMAAIMESLIEQNAPDSVSGYSIVSKIMKARQGAPNTPATGSLELCVDCGHERSDSRFHFEASGDNWGSALHPFRAWQPPLPHEVPILGETVCVHCSKSLSLDELGAACPSRGEARAPLPRCGHGVLLVDAGCEGCLAAAESKGRSTLVVAAKEYLTEACNAYNFEHGGEHLPDLSDEMVKKVIARWERIAQEAEGS